MVSSNQEEVIASAILHSNTSKIQLRAGAAASCSNRDCTFSVVHRQTLFLFAVAASDCSAVEKCDHTVTAVTSTVPPLNEHLKSNACQLLC
jgi:hypothetical protein